MAKTTTTKFEVTIEYKGNPKDFGKLVKAYKTATIADVKVLESTTKDLGPIDSGLIISDESKIIRRLVKSACEEAGLKWKVAAREKGEYYITYLCGGLRVLIGDYDACFNIHNSWNKMDYECGARYASAEDDPLAINRKGTITLADPDMFIQLVEIFKEMDRGTSGEGTNGTNQD